MKTKRRIALLAVISFIALPTAFLFGPSLIHGVLLATTPQLKCRDIKPSGREWFSWSCKRTTISIARRSIDIHPKRFAGSEYAHDRADMRGHNANTRVARACHLLHWRSQRATSAGISHPSVMPNPTSPNPTDADNGLEQIHI